MSGSAGLSEQLGEELIPVGDGTERKPVRLDGGRVELDVDLAVRFGDKGTVEPKIARVAVSPARAVEILDGLSDLRYELREAAAEQERAAEKARAASALNRTVELLTDPLLAGWSRISTEYEAGRRDEANGYQPGRGDYIQVLYMPRDADRLERYAAQAGLGAIRTSDKTVDELNIWTGSVDEGWINLHIQLAYYPDGRPGPAEEQAAGSAELDAAIAEVATIAAEDDAARAEQDAVDSPLAGRLAPGGAL